MKFKKTKFILLLGCTTSLAGVCLMTSCKSNIDLHFATYENYLRYSSSESFKHLISKKPSMDFTNRSSDPYVVGKALSKYMTRGDMTALMVYSLYTTWDFLSDMPDFAQQPQNIIDINIGVDKLRNDGDYKNRWDINISWRYVSLPDWTAKITYKEKAPNWDINPFPSVPEYSGFVTDLRILDVDLLYRFFNPNLSTYDNPYWDISVVNGGGLVDIIITMLEKLLWPSVFYWLIPVLFPDWKF